MHPDIFKLCQKFNLVQSIVKEMYVTTAAGHAVKTQLARLTLTIGGRTRASNFAILPECSSPIILGMRGILDWQIDYLASQDKFVFANSKQYRSKNAIVKPSKVQSVEPNSSKFIMCSVRDMVTDRPMYDAEVVANIMGTDILTSTNSDGKIFVCISNPSNEVITFERQHAFGTAQILTGDLEVSEVTTANIAALSTANQQQVVAALSKSIPSRKKAQMPQEEMELTDLIHGAIGHLPTAERDALQKILYKHQTCVSRHKFDLGLTDLHSHSIVMQDKEPVYHRQFPIPLDHADVIDEHVQQWIQMGIVEPANSQYNSPIFCVRKKDGSFRLCLDYRGVNSKSLPVQYSIRTPEDCVSELGKNGAKHFIALDLASGFYQMPLAKESRPITAFTVPKHGQLQWTRGAMGLKGCPGSFARLMDMALKGIDGVLIYIDDILIYGKTKQQAIETLEKVLKRLVTHNLKINIKKSVFLQPTTHYLGLTLTASGIFPGEDKARAIREAKPPQSVKQLKSFLGLCNYFRNFIKHFAHKAGKLYALTRKDASWKQGPLPPHALETFKILQNHIAQASPRAFPLKDGKYHLFTDASLGDDTDKGGLGAHLMQADEKGTLHTIAFASRQLKLHENNYSAFLLELQAAVWAIDHFSHYLKGRPFVLYTDHAPLTKLSQVHTKTLHRLHALLNEYHFEMKHVSGKKNAVADFLSRSHGPQSQQAGVSAVADAADLLTLREEQMEDPYIEPILRALLANKEPLWPDELKKHRKNISLMNGLVTITLPPRPGFLHDNKKRVLVPASLRQLLLKEAHNSALSGHQGIFKTLERIKESFWWPGMDSDVQQHTKTCKTCQATSNKDAPKPLPHQEFPQTRAPNERIHADLFGPITNQHKEQSYILGVTDSFTKVVRLAVIPNKEAKTVAWALWQHWFTIYGIAKLIVTDQGNEFCSALERAIFDILKIKHNTTTPYWPKANMAQERQNKELAHYIRTVLFEANKSTIDWELYLPALQLSLNTAVNKAIKMAPFRAMFGYDPRLPLNADLDILQEDQYQLPPRDKDCFFQWSDTLRSTRQIAHSNDRAFQDEQAAQNTAPMHSFSTGQKVWIKLQPIQDVNKKFAPKWEQAVVMERVGPTTYKVKRITAKRKRIVTLNAAYMKPFFSEAGPNEDADETTERNLIPMTFPGSDDLHDEVTEEATPVTLVNIDAVRFRDRRGRVYDLDQWIGRKQDHSSAELAHIFKRLREEADPNDYSLFLRRSTPPPPPA